ncbi:GAF domain-containing sensor histidine kinase [Candidatus Fermentibacteria bacterium]|nr:GAF domain-containing sensor histidine kinase [Candidatus Fermentibacteria bacterium]
MITSAVVFSLSLIALGVLIGRYFLPASMDRKTRMALSKAAATEKLEESLTQALEKLAGEEEVVSALLRTLPTMASRLSQSKSRDEVAQIVGDAAMALLGAKEAIVLMAEGSHLRAVWSRAPGIGDLREPIRLPEGRIGEMLVAGTVLSREDLHDAEIHPLNPDLWAPIGSRGELNGVIHVAQIAAKARDAPRLAGLIAQMGGISFRAIELTDRMGSFNKQLEAMVHERTLELRRAYEELKELDTAKDEFISSVSHELRTPLTSIRSFSELLLTFDDDQRERRREFLGIINDESKRLTRLIDDVLDIAKIESGQTEWRLQKLDIGELVRNVVELQKPSAEERKITLKVMPAPLLQVVIADRDRIKQVLVNLLSNAVKFSHPGDEVLVSSRMDGEEVAITVADQGVGIPQESRHRVFMRFQQLGDATTGKHPGTGLGLSICKEIVSRHGGRIWVDDNSPRGCVFTFTLPALAEHPSAEG